MNGVVLRTKSDRETQAAAALLARECLRGSGRTALVLGLIGDLGGGKTTFTAGFAKGLGVKKRITSPTFVLMKKFLISNRRLPIAGRKFFIHIDAYRLKSARELAALGWKELVWNPENIIVVEWADKIKRLLPKGALILKFKYLRENTREIIIFKNAKSKN